MRSTCEIIANIKDGKNVPYEELKMACLVQSSLLFFFSTRYKTLIKRWGWGRISTNNEL